MGATVEEERAVTARMQKLNEANEVLSDAAARARYDASIQWTAPSRALEGSPYCDPVGAKALSAAGLALARRRWRMEHSHVIKPTR